MMKILPVLILAIWHQSHLAGSQPPFLYQTTPVMQVPFYYPSLYSVFNCTGVNEGTATYQPWYSYFMTSTPLPTDNVNFTGLQLNYANPINYPIPETPIDCFSNSQLRNGSCTSYFTCVYAMNGTINQAPQCPSSMYCCMLPTCALIIGSQTRYGHCRPARTCPGTFDTVFGISVGCSDPVNAPCCVAEEMNITCPRNYDSYANALVKSYGLLNVTKGAATPQRVLAWAPFLLSAFDETVDMCIYDCNSVSFLQFFMDTLSEMFMFTSGKQGFYKRLIDLKGKSMGLLPASYFSIYSPYVFTNVVRFLFKNYNLAQLYGTRSFLSANRIFWFLNGQIGSPLQPDYSRAFTLLSWRANKYFASFLDCRPAMIDGAECSRGQGLCFIARNAALMNVSEYWRFCPRQLPLFTDDCLGYPANVVCCAKPYPPLKYGAHLIKNEFNDVVVAIHQSIYQDPSIIADLVRILTEASSALYRATRNRAYFRTITIISHWNGTHGNVTYETFRNADFKVVPQSPTLIPPQAVSLGTCGEPGLGVFLSQSHLRQWGASQTVAKLFAINRWGFGDEVPSNIGEAYYVPDDRIGGSAKIRAGSSCSANMKVDYLIQYGQTFSFNMTILDRQPFSAGSFAFRPDVFPTHNAEFCSTTTIPHCDDSRRHNPEPNTPHNRICNRTSTMATILSSPYDFRQQQNSPRFVGNTRPVFKFLKYVPVTSQVIAIVADFSGSIVPSIATTMINAVISLLEICPDEVGVVLVAVANDFSINVPDTPIYPYDPYLQPTGGWFFGRQRLIEQAKSWLYYIRPNIGPKNTSILKGVELLVNTYLPQPNYRLRILVFSDFFAVHPADTGLMSRMRQGGYSIWPVSLWSRAKVVANHLTYHYPLYHYIRSLANSTYGRWHFIADTANMSHWYHAIGSFLDDNNYGFPIYIDTFKVSPGQSLTIPFKIPNNYGLNTSIVVDYDWALHPAAVSGYQTNCTNDDRGWQNSFRAACRFGNLTASPINSISVSFGKISNTTDAKTVTVMIVSRAVEFGSAYVGQAFDMPQPWDDPWQNRNALAPNDYPKIEVRVPHGNPYIFERSREFRFPKVHAILYQGQNAIIGCQLEYDLYVSNYTTAVVLKQIVSSGKLYDDGQGEDGFANDGVYTALLVGALGANGTYTVHVRLRSQGSTGCIMKPGIALVGYPNNNASIFSNDTQPTSVTLSFHKSASFDVLVPPGTEDVMYLGLVVVQSCNVRNATDPVSFASVDQYKLPSNFIIFCNIYPMTVESRYSVRVMYNMAVTPVVGELNLRSHYWANASGFSNLTRTKQPDGQETFQLFLNMTPAYVAPIYYAVIWATDGKGNYATRSNIFAIQLPTFYNNQSGRITNMPLFTDITTAFPRPDDVWPDSIIYSCIAGGAFAFILLVTAAICFCCRRPSSRLLVPPPGRPYGFMPDNRVAILSRQKAGPRPVSMVSGEMMMPMSVPAGQPPPYMPSYGPTPHPQQQYGPQPAFYPTPRQQANYPNSRPQSGFNKGGRVRSNAEIIFPSSTLPPEFDMQPPPMMPMPSGTAERQNAANMSRQARYRRGNDITSNHAAPRF